MIRNLLVVALFIAGGCFCTAAPASDNSVRELLTVTETRKLLDGMIPQMDNLMRGAMQQALNQRNLSPEQQKRLEALQTRLFGVMKDELRWENLEPLYIGVYRQTFTQEEVDGMLAFYKSPAGVAMVRKMPQVMQGTMTAMQQKIGPIMQKTQAALEETLKEFDAESAKK